MSDDIPSSDFNSDSDQLRSDDIEDNYDSFDDEFTVEDED